MFLARKFLFSKASKLVPHYSYGVFKSGDISMDLLLTLSMQQADKQYKNHDELVNSLVSKEILKNNLLIKSMKNLDRSFFVETSALSDSLSVYQDKPHSIGYGEDISAQMMQALAAETLYPVIESLGQKDSVHFVDVGTGSGYLSMLLFDAFTHRFLNDSKFKNLNILGFDVEENLVKRTNLIFADLLDKGIIKLHPSISLNFVKRDFYEFLNSLETIEEENQVFNIGAAIDLQAWEDLKKFISQKQGAILSPVIQNDGEQSLMFYKSIEGKTSEESLMKVMYATLRQGAKPINPEISKYFLDKDDISEDAPANTPNKMEGNTEESLSEDMQIINLKKEIESLENQIKLWTNERRAAGSKAISLKDMQADPGMSNVLTQLNKQKRKLNIFLRATKQN